MIKLYYLSTCDTCKRIIKEWSLPKKVTLQDIKTSPLLLEELEQLKLLSGNYESLFNKRARLYKEQNLKEKNLTEEDYKHLLLQHYTFLKRPVLLIKDQIFIGNSKKMVETAKTAIKNIP